jgi:hypothetical protein
VIISKLLFPFFNFTTMQSERKEMFFRISIFICICIMCYVTGNILSSYMKEPYTGFWQGFMWTLVGACALALLYCILSIIMLFLHHVLLIPFPRVIKYLFNLNE